MGSKCVPGNVIGSNKEKFWENQYELEDKMRLRWFTLHQKQLKELAEAESAKKGLSPEVLAEVDKMKEERRRNIGGSEKAEKDPDFPDIDPHCIINIMLPVDPKTKKIFYDNMQKLGRTLYLKARYKKRPENRYYFRECSSFACGWKITTAQKRMSEEVRRGRRLVIQNSFYRRGGALKADPPFYREPQ